MSNDEETVGDEDVFFSTKDIIEAQKFWGEVLESKLVMRNMARIGEPENTKKVLELTVQPILKNFDGEPWAWNYPIGKSASGKWFSFLKSLEEVGIEMKKPADLKGRVLLWGEKTGQFQKDGKTIDYRYRVVLQKGSKEEALKEVNAGQKAGSTASAAPATSGGGSAAPGAPHDNVAKLLEAVKSNPGSKEELMKRTGLDLVSFVKARQALTANGSIEEKEGIFLPK